MLQKGFANVLIIIVLVGLFIGGVFWVNYKSSSVNNQNKGKLPSSANEQNDKNSQTTIRLSGIVNGNPPCTNSGRVTLTKPFMNPSDIKAIFPLGETVNAHVTPIDHQYYIPTDSAKKNGTAIYAPADGIIFGIIGADASKNAVEEVNVPSEVKYSLALAFSCSEAMTLGYVSTIEPEFQKYITYDLTSTKPISIPVKSGQKLGIVKGSMDVWLIDTTSKLTGFIDDGDYIDENWKPYSHSLADYFAPALRDQYNAKSLRKVLPLGGKIDYDQQGKLIGNWFKQGVLPYFMRQKNFWQNEIAIFYDFIDPTQIRIMIGQFATDRVGVNGFDVLNNAPDPATISVSSGLVKYSLVNYTYVDESGQDVGNFDYLTPDKIWHVQNKNSVWGVALVQMIEGRKIKFETFVGKTVDQVSGFTSNAQIYER